jgi:hypothetical protein
MDSAAERIGMMLGTQGIRPAEMHAFQCLLHVTAEGERFAQFD